MFKSKKGFTLVELIVVIAILAILAGVGTVAYSGYIEKANDAAVLSDLDAILTASTAANATAGEIDKIIVQNPASAEQTVTIIAKTALADDFKDDFEIFFTGSTVTMPAEGATGDAAKTATVSISEIAGWVNTKYNKDDADKGAIWDGSEWDVAVAADLPA